MSAPIRVWLLLSVLLAACAGGSPSVSVPASTTATPQPKPPEPSGPVTLIVDTDVAPDDLVAIAFLVNAPQVAIAAITVSGTGEAHCGAGVSIVLALLTRLEAAEIPVSCGPEQPLGLDHAFPDPFRENADNAGGLDLPDSGRSPADEPAVTLLQRTVAESAEPVWILTLGPLTNLAVALQADPDLATGVAGIVVMGGAIDVPGNIAGSPDAPSDNTSAEWNIYADPVAAGIVVDAGADLTVVSLDGTNDVPITPEFASRVHDQAQGRGLRVLAELMDRNDYMTSGSYYLWDVMAAMVAAGYPIGSLSNVRLEVDETEGPTSGATQRVDGEPNARFLDEVDPALVEVLLLDVLNAR